MRNVYLVRHGHPDFPIGSRICLGRTDIPLGPLGHLQSVLLARTFSSMTFSGVYSSPLHRAYDTACHFSTAPIVHPGLTERATGLWDGFSFDEIAQRWPAEYAQRADNPERTMPGGEETSHACARFSAALQDILAHSTGDIAIVAHKGVITAFLQALHADIPLPKLPYGAYWHLSVENNVPTLKTETPIQPQPLLDRALCLALLQAVAPENVVQHCEAVAAFTQEIAEALPLAFDTTLIAQAALLHDIARTFPDHATLGGQWLALLGYPRVAAVVRRHHDPLPDVISEASIVAIADNCLQGAQRVPLRERFAASRKKCQSPEALAAWKTRLVAAESLQKTINHACGKEIIL